MRDLLVTAFVFGSIPFILKKPYVGVLMWTLMGLMNPHRLCWGFALSIPFSQIIALALLASLLISAEKKALPNSTIVVFLGLFTTWMFITTLQAFEPHSAWLQWNKVWKTLLLIFITIMMLTNKARIISLVLVIIISLGFYGVKGGIFTLLTGGQYHVLGPPGTYIEENNALGLAIIMTIPLMRFMQLQVTDARVKKWITLGIALMLVSVAGSQSRGAFLGVIAMAFFLLLKSSHKGVLFAGLALLLPAIFIFMPDAWVDRMASIQNYEQDESATARIDAWTTIWRIALDYPIFGGGFQVYSSWAWQVYTPTPGSRFDIHSIYFEILGEHGFVGLFLFLGIGMLAFRKAGRIAVFARKHERLSWMRDLASMIQVSIIGYAASGTFLGLAYYDFPYVLVTLVVGLEALQGNYQKLGIPEFEGTGLFPAVHAPDSAAGRFTKHRRNRGPDVKHGGGRQRGGKWRDAIRSWYSAL